MAVARTWSLKFVGDINDLQKKAAAAKRVVEGTASSWQRASDGLKSAGSGMSSVGGQITKGITAPIVAATTAAAGLTAGLGFKRLAGIDRAKAQFEGLGHDVDKVMEQVDKGVTNTALSMAEGASLAVGALATGNLPLKDLEAQIKRVSNVSAAYGVEAEQAGYLLNNVLTKNKVTWGDLSQMQQNQIPIVSGLAKHYNVSGDAIMKMAQEGKISIEDLNQVLDKEAGKAAESYASSWEGITANIKSNIGKLGADVLAPVFEKAKVAAADFLAVLKADEVRAFATAVGVQLGDGLGRAAQAAQDLISWWRQLSPEGQRLIGIMAGIAVAIGPVLLVIGKMLSTFGFLAGLVPKIAAGFGAVKVAIAAITGPVGLAVAAIAAVVAGLTAFFTKTETGRKLLSGFITEVTGGFRAFGAAWKAFDGDITSAGFPGFMERAAFIARTAWESLKSAAQTAGSAIITAFSAVVAWYRQHLAPTFAAIGELIRAVTTTIIVPVLQELWRKWQETWNKIKAVWAVVGPPLMAIIGTAFEQLKTVIDFIWRQIRNVIETALGVIRGIIQTITGLIQGDWSKVWNGIKTIGESIWNGIKNSVGNTMQAMSSTLSNIWNGIKVTALRVWNGVRSTLMGIVNPLVTRITTAFQGARDGVGRAFDGLKAKVAKPVNFVIETVWNNGLLKMINMIPGLPDYDPAPIIKGYRGGGFTGWGRDDEWAGGVHRNEYVLNAPEVRAMGGPTGVDRWKRETLGGEGGQGALGGAVRPVPGGHSGWNGGRYRWSGKYHGGLDFPAPTGTAIRAMWAGTVTRALRLNRSYGHHAIINHGGGISTLYAHMSRLGVRAGQHVGRGSVIGAVGSTGNSTGPHLHLEVRRGGARLNPTPYLGGAKIMKGKDGDVVHHQEPLLFEIPKIITGILSSIRSGLDSPWGELLKTGIISSMGTFKDWVLEKIPGFQHGTVSAPKGYWLAGEGGPELVYSPHGGDRVNTAGQTRHLLGHASRNSQAGEQQFEALITKLDRLIDAIERGELTPELQVYLDEGDIKRSVRSEVHRRTGGVRTLA